MVGGGSTARTVMTTATTASKRVLPPMPKRRVMFVCLLGCSGSCGVRVSKSGISLPRFWYRVQLGAGA